MIINLTKNKIHSATQKKIHTKSTSPSASMTFPTALRHRRPLRRFPFALISFTAFLLTSWLLVFRLSNVGFLLPFRPEQKFSLNIRTVRTAFIVNHYRNNDECINKHLQRDSTVPISYQPMLYLRYTVSMQEKKRKCTETIEQLNTLLVLMKVKKT